MSSAFPSASEQRLASLGLVLPAPAAAAANYLPYVIQGGVLTVSGQLPLENGAVAVRGKLGAEVTLADGQRAARLCALNILAQARQALGDLDKARRCIRLIGYVASAPGFTDQHKVMNGGSDLIVAILGEAGKHARAAVGVAALPLDAAVEIEAQFAVD
jgi:enamine deaminase RidA (YjgF/YER057c/UK114 family)